MRVFLFIKQYCKMEGVTIMITFVLVWCFVGTTHSQTIHVTAYTHQTLTMNCTLIGSIEWRGPPNLSSYSWKSQTNPPGIPENMRNRVNITGDFLHGHYNLEIKDVQLTDAGHYACFDQKNLRQNYTLNVVSATPSTTTTTTSTTRPSTTTPSSTVTPTTTPSTITTTPPSTTPSTIQTTVIVSATAASLVTGIIFLFCCVMYVRKKKPVVFQQLMYTFQKYEDDETKTYDAFVSFKSETRDTEFVFDQLYQTLEKDLGFKLCIHEKDFVPGKGIRNNIVDAITDSRRTIMVITQDYLQAGFTTFEYEVAHHEMLTSKHKIIPILLDPMEKLVVNMDDTMKHILTSVTYIQWPNTNNRKDKMEFWKRLRLSMPKKAKRQSIKNSRSSLLGTLLAGANAALSEREVRGY